MKTNEINKTGNSTLFIALGTIIGVLAITALKAFNLDMPLADTVVKTLPEAFGRAACVAVVFGIYSVITNKNK